MSFEVQKQALEHDAKIWEVTSETLSGASTSASGLHLTTTALSVVADATGFASSYASIQQFVVSLLADGSSATSNMASTLRSVKKQYEADEDAAVTRIGAQWSPVE
ncbi:MAG: hypothetical protein ABIQ61_12555 [Ornithinibacter sp.]